MSFTSGVFLEGADVVAERDAGLPVPSERPLELFLLCPARKRGYEPAGIARGSWWECSRDCELPGCAAASWPFRAGRALALPREVADRGPRRS